MSPAIKKALSVVAAAVAGAALVAIQKTLVPLAPIELQATLVAALAAVAHYIPTAGSS